MKQVKQRLLSFLTAFLVVFTTVFGNASFVVRAEGEETIATWSCDKEKNVTSDNLSLGLEGGPAQDFLSDSIKGTDWTNGGYWHLTFDATGYENITLNFKAKSSGTGPKDFKASYKTSDSDWIEIEGYSVTKNLANKSLSIPVANQGIEIKLEVSGNSSLTEEKEIASGGTSAINNIVIKGTPISGGSEGGEEGGSGESGEEKEACAAVIATPSAGEVEKGAAVSLSCETEDATIYYDDNGDNNFEMYTSPIQIDADMTIKAFSHKEGFNDSEPVSFTYTVKEEIPEEIKPGTKLDEVKDGDSFVVVFGDKNIILTSDVYEDGKKNKKLVGVEGKIDAESKALYVEKSKNTESLVDKIVTFTAKEVSEEIYELTDSEGKFLSTTETGGALFFVDTKDDYSEWKIEKKADSDSFFIINTKAKYKDKEQRIEFYNQFTAYSYPQDKGNDAFELFLYSAPEVKEVEEQTEKETPNEAKELDNHDRVIMVIKDKALDTSFAGKEAQKGEDGSVYASDSVVLSVQKADDGYIFKDEVAGKYLSAVDAKQGLVWVDDVDEFSKWTVEAQEKGGFIIKNNKAEYTKNGTKTAQHIEYYKNFTTYIAGTGDAYLVKFYYAETAPIVPPVEEPDTNENKNLKDGDIVVMYAEKKVLTSTANGTRLNGVDAVIDDEGNLTVPDGAAYLKVVYDEEQKNYAFKDAITGLFLTSGPTGSALSFTEELTDLGKWILEKKGDGFNVKNKAALYNAKTAQYIEFYQTFTTYSLKDQDAFIVRFFNATLPATVDTETVLGVASWGGNANYADAGVTTEVYGDASSTNDMGDASAKFRAVLSGANVQPYMATTSTSTHSTNYYMGAKGIGSGSDDYLEFEIPYSGYGNGELSFRIKASNTGAGSFQLKYSIDDGKNFNNFSTGTYAYTTSSYSGGGAKDNYGDITNGIADISKASSGGVYESFTFDIPEGANDADKLLIRLVPGNKSAGKNSQGEYTIAVGGTVRIDSVVITAHPLVSGTKCAFVKSTPTAGAIPAGTMVALSTATDNATIMYSVNGAEYAEYNAAEKIAIDTFPATIRTYAKAEGLKDSITTTYTYTQEKVDIPTVIPNGGSVRETDKIKFKSSTEGAKIFYAYAAANAVIEETSNTEDAETAEGEESTEAEEPETEENAADDNYDWIEYTGAFVLDKLPCTLVIKATKEGCIDSPIKTLKFTKKSGDKYNIYFGQIHSHTNFSDGAGSCEEAFIHASTEVANLDFLAVTDHSNSLDGDTTSDIAVNKDTSADMEWTKGHALAEQYSRDDFTCLYGYEMTWSNGLGHMNTFCTPGFQSRSQQAYTTYSTALSNYYAALNRVPDSISMFNHPGTTFGDFQDFAYFSEANDALINLIEVGNGEGAIGSAGYFPSYEYYTRALDKGWHVAPTNNQDNHKGLWGDANTARTVVLADSNNEENIYDAMRNRRIYATEDNNLSIYYTLNGNIMGTALEKEDVDDTVNISVDVSDASGEAIGTVQVIVNGGLVLAEKKVASSEETVTFNLESNYSYYYIKVVEADGDIAVTAPVWVGDVEACGINSVTTTTTLPVQNENADINIDFYNNEKADLLINEITIELQNSENEVSTVAVLKGDDIKDVATVGSNKTAGMTFNHVYDGAGKVTYIVTAKGSLRGVDKIYVGKLTMNYATAQMVGEVIVDASHYNDYVAGYYAGNMKNFTKLCAEQNLRVTLVKDKITAEMLKDARVLVISAPAAAKDTKNNPPMYEASTFEPEFVELVKEYVENGGKVILCGIADYNNFKAASEQNKILEALGSTIRVNSDEVIDDENNGGQEYRLYPTNYKADSKYLYGVKEGQTYSQYSGCSITVGEGETDTCYEAEKLIWGFDTTYSKDCKDESGKKIGDEGKGIKNDNLGDITFLAHQETKSGGDIIVAGGVFVSDFEVKAELDNIFDLPYINYTIATNIINDNKVVLPTATIAEARKGNTGDVFAVEGYVTSGTDNASTTFFDTIYIEDETAGIDIFPYATPGLKLGTKVRIVGFVSSYQGDKELKVLSAEILNDEPKLIEPKEVSCKDAMDYDKLGGSLLKTTGVVQRVRIENNALAEIWLSDDSGKEAAIFIDGYIYSKTTGKNTLAESIKVGDEVSAVGVLYIHPEDGEEESVPVLRVRNCDEIVVLSQVVIPSVGGGTSSGAGAGASASGSTSTETTSPASTTPATTVPGTTTPQGTAPEATTPAAAVVNAAAEVAANTTNIEDAQTPLADSNYILSTAEEVADESLDSGDSDVTITENQTATSASVESSNAKVAAYAIIVLVAAAAVIAAVLLRIKREKNAE